MPFIHHNLCSSSFYCVLLTLLVLVCRPVAAQAQETEESMAHAHTYLNSRTQYLDKYLNRSEKIQQRLLNKLKRKETRLARKLAGSDSTAYAGYQDQPLTFDSISKLSRDTASLTKHASPKNPTIDSLKKIAGFAAQQSGKLSSDNIAIQNPYTDKLAGLQQRLNAQQQVDELIRRRTSNLESLGNKAGVPGLQSIQKNVYYAREKIQAWKTLADDPDEAEEKALEYLQGTEGFSKYLNPNNNAFGGLGNNATAEDLQAMGFQTKIQVNSLLQDKMGNNLGAVQQQMAGQLQQYSDKLNGITGKVQEAKNNIGQIKNTGSEALRAKDKLKNIEKPAFKKNPERGKPFWQRLETQYNFQTTRATPNGLRPAMMELGASIGYRQSPKLSFGIGIGLSTGLGQNWQHIRLSYEGISARVYADRLWQYGFSLQAGYERIFRPAGRPYLTEQTQNNNNTQQADHSLKDAFGGRQQAAYIGIMKRYRINSKWNGTFLAGYNFLWQQEGMKSPFMLRLGWGK